MTMLHYKYKNEYVYVATAQRPRVARGNKACVLIQMYYFIGEIDLFIQSLHKLRIKSWFRQQFKTIFNILQWWSQTQA